MTCDCEHKCYVVNNSNIPDEASAWVERIVMCEFPETFKKYEEDSKKCDMLKKKKQ